VTTESKDVVCLECGKSFPGEYILKMHREGVHGIKASPRRAGGSAIAPVGPGGIIRGTFALYVKRFPHLMAIALIGQALLALVVVGISHLVAGSATASADDLSAAVESGRVAGGTMALVLGLLIASVPLSLLAQGAIMHAVLEHKSGRPMGIRGVYALALRRLWGVLGVGFLLVGIIVLASVLAFVGMLGVGAVLSVLGRSWFVSFIEFGLAVFVVVSFVILMLRFSFVLQAAFLEGHGATDALASSWDLVRGNGWRVFGIMLLMGILLAPVTLVMNYVAVQVPVVASVLVYAPLAPLGLIAQTLLYLDLRGR
jgi:hypothetical protein